MRMILVVTSLGRVMMMMILTFWSGWTVLLTQPCTTHAWIASPWWNVGYLRGTLQSSLITTKWASPWLEGKWLRCLVQEVFVCCAWVCIIWGGVPSFVFTNMTGKMCWLSVTRLSLLTDTTWSIMPHELCDAATKVYCLWYLRTTQEPTAWSCSPTVTKAWSRRCLQRSFTFTISRQEPMLATLWHQQRPRRWSFGLLAGCYGASQISSAKMPWSSHSKRYVADWVFQAVSFHFKTTWHMVITPKARSKLQKPRMKLHGCWMFGFSLDLHCIDETAKHDAACIIEIVSQGVQRDAWLNIDIDVDLVSELCALRHLTFAKSGTSQLQSI